MRLLRIYNHDDHESLKWSYEDQSWESLGYVWCAKGMHQSPVDIKTKECIDFTQFKPLVLYDSCTSFHGKIKNCGHGCQVYCSGKKTLHISFSGRTYQFLQFHLHSQSEHTINGEHYPLELHLVHQNVDPDNKADLLVIAVLFRVGEIENEFLAQFLEMIPKKDGASHRNLEIHLDSLELEPSFYSYDGSLTTPPCTEGVHWIIMKDIKEVSEDQMYLYRSKYNMNTNRKTQPLNDRVIKSY